ncbi:hypothetical protein TNCV_3716011 [Trichonephila clavipes]|nr:hypothetical protein TNCV_3716011 [Trichonephila clavipes]
MVSDWVNVEAMRNKLYREALCGKSIARVQWCSTNPVMRDAREAVRSPRNALAVHWTIAIDLMPTPVVEHQDRHNQLRLALRRRKAHTLAAEM